MRRPARLHFKWMVCGGRSVRTHLASISCTRRQRRPSCNWLRRADPKRGNLRGRGSARYRAFHELPRADVGWWCVTVVSSDGPTSCLPGATFKLNGFNETIGALNDGGSVVNGTTTAATLTINQATGTSTFSGKLGGTRLGDDNFALMKVGGATLILAGTNTYTGLTTVGGGKLVVNGSLASDLSVSNGAILGGSGLISGSVQVDSGGTVSPGSSPGLLTVGSLSLQSGSTFRVELNGTAAGTQYEIGRAHV